MNFSSSINVFPLSRTPFPHPASMFSPPGSRPGYSAYETLSNLSAIALEYSQTCGNKPISIDDRN